MFLTKKIEQVQALVQQVLLDNDQKLVGDIAQELNLSEGEITLALPEEMVTCVAPEHCEFILQQLSDWGNVTTIVHSFGSIFEFKSPFPKGKLGHGYYNIMGKEGLHGHLHIDLIKQIAFVSKLFRGMESHYIVFFTAEGDCIFKIYLGRDKKRQLLSTQVEAFTNMKNTLAS